MCDSLCDEIGHFTARIVLIVYIVYPKSNNS
jgi:hypothetical protein